MAIQLMVPRHVTVRSLTQCRLPQIPTQNIKRPNKDQLMSRMADDRSFRYPHFEASGSPRQLGRQHGEQAAVKITGFVGYLCESLRLSEAELSRRARMFLPLMKQHCPRLVEEVRGLAEGAGIRFEQALACQFRGELAQASEGACTSFAIGPRGTADGNVLIGQTSDTPTELRAFGYVLHLRPDDRPECIMWTFGGMLGYHGLNEHGVAHFANSLGGGPAWKFGLSHYPLKRLILEQQSLDAVQRLIAGYPVCSNGNYMLCDGAGQILDIEATSAGSHRIDDAGAGFIAHSNHYLCDGFACEQNFAQSLPDSFPRLDRIRTLIAEKFGSITVPDMQQILADHDNHPVSICRHPHTGAGDDILPPDGHTIAAIIAEPSRGRLHISSGNPCEMPFIEHCLSTAS